jgi:hypothetical protein
MEVDRTFSQWSMGSSRIKWSAVFAGWAVGLAVQMVLSLAGLGFGAWAIDLHDANPTEDIPVGAAVWTGLSMLISAFVGGYVTARLSGASIRSDGVYHGVVVWGVNWLVFAWLTTTAMATMIGGAFSILGTTLQTVAEGLSHATPRVVGHVNLTSEDVRRELESVLRATGKPELQPDEVRRDAGRAVDKGRRGEAASRITDQSTAELRERLSALDREAAVTLMMNKFGMSDAQARDVVQSTIGLLRPAQGTLRGVKPQASAFGADALDRLGMIALWLSGLALISLVISAIGGMLGTPDDVWMESGTRMESYRDFRRAS